MLSNILHAFVQYKVLSLILLFAVILTVFAWSRALRASRRHNAERNAVLAKLREEESLRSRYSAITPELAAQAPMPEMLHGLALCIQKALDDAPDPEQTFAALSEAQQYIYALNYVFCEDADTLSRFFRLNGKPLTTTARDAAQQMFDETTATLFARGCKMFDSEDETTSSLPANVASLDEAFAAADKTALFDSVRAYICVHTDTLCAPQTMQS